MENKMMPQEQKGEVQVKGLRIVDLPLSVDTDRIWHIPKGCKRFSIKARDSTHIIRVATEPNKAGASQPDYYTIGAATPWSESNLDISEDLPLYFASSDSGCVVEIFMGI